MRPIPCLFALLTMRKSVAASAPMPFAAQPDTIITLADINFIEDSPNLTEASQMIIPEYVRTTAEEARANMRVEIKVFHKVPHLTTL
jgi:hypothetical protein